MEWTISCAFDARNKYVIINKYNRHCVQCRLFCRWSDSIFFCQLFRKKNMLRLYREQTVSSYWTDSFHMQIIHRLHFPRQNAILFNNARFCINLHDKYDEFAISMVKWWRLFAFRSMIALKRVKSFCHTLNNSHIDCEQALKCLYIWKCAFLYKSRGAVLFAENTFEYE